MLAGGDKVWYIRGVGGTMEHGEGSDVQGNFKMIDTIPRMLGGTHSGVYDGALEAGARDGSRNQLAPAAGQSYRTPAPRVLCHISKGHLPDPIPRPMFPGVVLYSERPP